MQIHLVSYADGSDYLVSGRHVMKEALASGQFASVDLWTRQRLEQTDWYRDNSHFRNILSESKGAGLWAWKPLVLLETLRQHPGDFVMWHDAGRTRYRYWEAFQHRLPLLEFAQAVKDRLGSLFVAPSTFLQRQWTRRYCLEKLGCDTEDLRELPQFCAYFIFAESNAMAREFAEVWLSACSDPRLIGETPHEDGEYADFRAHRWEQSILTALLYEYEKRGRLQLALHHLFTPQTYRDIRRIMSSAISLTTQRRLHIGGTTVLKGWEVFNIVSGPHVDHVGDARDLSRFPDGTFCEIYASHILEHFSYVRELNPVLKEWARVIAPGGQLCLSVPDMDRLAALILNKSLSFKERFVAMRMLFGGQSNDYDFHQVGLNFEILSLYLRSNGFYQIRRIDNFGYFKDSSRKVHAGIQISLNIRARKRIQVRPEV